MEMNHEIFNDALFKLKCSQLQLFISIYYQAWIVIHCQQTNY